MGFSTAASSSTPVFSITALHGKPPAIAPPSRLSPCYGKPEEWILAYPPQTSLDLGVSIHLAVPSTLKDDSKDRDSMTHAG